jgi:3',5'-cyclic AMP phosphodiesterase CpdA
VVELVSVAPDGAELFVDGAVVRIDGLEPGRSYERHGTTFTTLPDLGARVATFATANDVHLGETVCGRLEGAEGFEELRSDPGAPPYPEVMNAAVIEEMAGIAPDVVVVKGDLTDDGEDADYARFLELWGGRFGERLVHVRGNHDCFRGQSFAAWPHQERALEGVTLAVLDTSRPHFSSGFVDAGQLDWLDELGARTDGRVVVLGHHPIWNPGRDQRTEGFQGIAPDDSAALIEIFARRRSLVAYLCGHSHCNRRQLIGGIPFVEVACVKDFPGGWAEYRVHERGIAQVFHRAAARDAVVWAERTRGMFAGFYGPYAMGELDDRSFVIPDRVSG